MVLSVKFDLKNYHDNTPEVQLREWTKGMDREDIISVIMHDDGSITLFYWND